MLKTAALLVSLCLVVAFAATRAPHRGHAAPPPSRIDVPVAGVTVPMKDFGGRPLVDVFINDKGPFTFILDTGASITVLGEQLQRDLSLESPAGVHAGSPGNGASPKIVTVPSLKLAEATIGDFMAAVMPLAGLFKTDGAPSGVLSASSFPGCLVIFDYPGKTITIKQGALEPADSRTIFEYAADEALPAVPVRLAGHETYVHIDTGSAFTLTLPRRFLAELPLKSKPRDVAAVRLPGGSFPVSSAAVDGPITVGSYTLDIPEVRFSDVRPGAELGPGNIGYDVLRQFVVTLDSKNRRLKLTR